MEAFGDTLVVVTTGDLREALIGRRVDGVA